MKQMGRRIKRLREEMGLTQREVQDQVEERYEVSMSQGYMSGIETGRAMPSARIMWALSQFFMTTSDYMLCLTDNPYENDISDGITIVENDKEKRGYLAEILADVSALSTFKAKQMADLVRSATRLVG